MVNNNIYFIISDAIHFYFIFNMDDCNSIVANANSWVIYSFYKLPRLPTILYCS